MNRKNILRQQFGANLQSLQINFPYPNIETPNTITWLSTPLTLLKEGEHMSHCIGSSHYCGKAQRGNSAFYHIDYDNEQATIELALKDNEIVQICGINNQPPTAKLKKVVLNWVQHL